MNKYFSDILRYGSAAFIGSAIGVYIALVTA